MPRYAAMLADGMRKRGHTVEICSPEPFFFRLPVKKGIRKWLGYIDQYIIFPQQVKRRMKNYKAGTLFVFSDQALGPWVPLVAKYPHVIHCHDFLAQRSALGELPENSSGWTGRKYQAFIRRGFRKGRNFISVSKKTREELHRFLVIPPLRSEVVYNGLNQSFHPGNISEIRSTLSTQLNIDLSIGYILHVGGNQWYKNRKGVIEIYEAWRKKNEGNLPLLMVGKMPGKELMDYFDRSAFKAGIHWLTDMNDEQVRMVYAAALVFLFPSLAEGFGWPIAEAMASGCPVITTNEAPMTEVAGDAGFLVNRKPLEIEQVKTWASHSAETLNKVISFSGEERKKVVDVGIENAKRFNPEDALDKIEALYKEIVESN